MINQELELQIFKLQRENEILKKSVNFETSDISHLLKSVLDNSKNKLFFALDDQYKLLDFNNYCKTILDSNFQVTLEIGMNWFDIFDSQKLNISTHFNFDIAFSGKSYKETKYFKSDNKEYYFEFEYNPIVDKNNKIVGITAFALEISDRVLAQNGLIGNELKYKTLLSNIGDVIGIISAEGLIKYKSPNIEKIFGWNPVELVGVSAFLNIYIDDLTQVESFFNRILAKEIVSGDLEFRYRCKNGEYKWVLLKAVNKMENAEINGILINYSDITDRKAIEKTLLESEQTFRALFEKGPIGVAYHRMIYDEQGTPVDYIFLDANASYKKLTGINPIGLLVTEAFPGIEHQKEPFDWIGTFGDIAKNGKEFRFQQYLESNDRWYDCVGYQYKQDHFVAAFLEITEQKRAEIELQKKQKELELKNHEFETLNEELKKANDEFYSLNEEYKTQNEELQLAKEIAEQNNQLKTAFLQNMSHEIRTPLNAICGFSAMLDKSNLTPEKQSNFISIIQSSSDQLLSVVSDILTISSIETKQEKLSISKVSVNKILHELESTFKQQSALQNISLYSKPTLEEEKSEIFSDNSKILQILTNLISNAFKFTTHGSIEFGYELKSPFLEFYVKDSGIGIKKEMYQDIFERFRQADLTTSRQYGGTGLGLSISKGFVELMGGDIWVDSELSKGSTFYFTVPYNPVNEMKEVALESKSRIIKTVLIADDEIFNYLFLEELLINFNLKLIHTKNGDETFEICKNNSEIDLILMDIKMPIMDGHTAAKMIKEFRPNLPIIAQSAYALEHEIEKYTGIFDDYLTKPINEADLFQVLSKYVKN